MNNFSNLYFMMYALYSLLYLIYMHLLKETYFLEEQCTVIVNCRGLESPVKNFSKIWVQKRYFPNLPQTYREFCCKKNYQENSKSLFVFSIAYKFAMSLQDFLCAGMSVKLKDWWHTSDICSSSDRTSMEPSTTLIVKETGSKPYQNL